MRFVRLQLIQHDVEAKQDATKTQNPLQCTCRPREGGIHHQQGTFYTSNQHCNSLEKRFPTWGLGPTIGKLSWASLT